MPILLKLVHTPLSCIYNKQTSFQKLLKTSKQIYPPKTQHHFSNPSHLCERVKIHMNNEYGSKENYL